MFRLELQAQPYLSVSRTSIGRRRQYNPIGAGDTFEFSAARGALPRETGARLSILRRLY